MALRTLKRSQVGPKSFLMRVADEWWFWPESRCTEVARSLDRVIPLLEEVDRHTKAGGWATGAVQYDAAPAFDPAYQVHPGKPPEWFAFFAFHDDPPDVYDTIEPPSLKARAHPLGSYFERGDYERKFKAIKAHLAAGDVYQVNLTRPLTRDQEVDAYDSFSLSVCDEPPPYSAYFCDPVGPVICFSPELFFERTGRRIVSKPMKGTRERATARKTDRELRESLATSEKDQAENLMIVDMIRNDLGKIADVGSVRVSKLFEVEEYPTVWQMTSTVEAETDASLTDVFRALFPCASITGAPKVQAMKVIAEVEHWNRRLYTGSIGFAGPGQAQFNVAIRTTHLRDLREIYPAMPEQELGEVFGAGGGIVWDSTVHGEHAESFVKSHVAVPYGVSLDLIETIRWEPESGCLFLAEHLRRLLSSARTMGREVNIHYAIRRLATIRGESPRKVRLIVRGEPYDWVDTIHIESTPLSGKFCWEPPEKAKLKVRIADRRVDFDHPWLRHKTSYRAMYRYSSDANDTILVNTREHATEFTIGNLVIERDGWLVTPTETCGLLLGVFREELLERGVIHRGIITLDELRASKAIYRINSVRGWERATLIENSQ